MEGDRVKATKIVNQFLNGGYDSEDKDAEMLAKLHQILPGSDVEKFLFWGPEGPENKRYESLTAEEIVGEAWSCRPIRLSLDGHTSH